MTSRQPTLRLIDVLKRNSAKTLQRNAAECAAASTALPAEALQTRFLRNNFLIPPKALQLLADPQTLSRWKLFALYKPPFCPMRRAEAGENYHKVSVESFVTAALRSREVLPTVQREVAPKDLHVRVLNDLDAVASGPVVVSVSDQHPFATSLDGFTMEYDVLVAGHLTIGGIKEVPSDRLFDLESSPSSSSSFSHPHSASPTCSYEVRRNAYYSVHPVSLINLRIESPPTPRPPHITRFIAEQLNTCVIGDPAAMDTLVYGRKPHSTAAGPAAGAEQAGAPPRVASNVVALRGDCDFPRVFVHLREVYIRADVTDVRGGPVSPTAINFHCRKCFDNILQSTRVFSMKANRISVLDGSWTPAAELL